jgi:predicted ATPase/class 3 adenylate cyclase
MAAAAQPAGTVTLVFTDVEGSTRLLEELGTEPYRQVLAEHRRVVRDACGRHQGYEVDYEGDAFFFAFSSADQAVAAVSEARAGLESGPIRIRVGIHTGEPALDPPKYVGLDVHLAARVMASAHGGQVVMSHTTCAQLDGTVPTQELGEHRLKDIDRPVALFQLGGERFPPLRTISNTNLPRPASSFVGREAELAEVRSRLAAGARLLTLTGPGGTGKTRLALEAAATLVPDYKAGVFWVGFAGLRDPALVTETIAQTIGAKDGLADHIGERETLLLLDNLEQVIEAAPELAALASACPNLGLLVTSRELLRVHGEVEYPVPPLARPEATTLFCQRSQLEPSKEIAELCARLDNLPLAVELAAARTRALTPAQILGRLSQRLDLLRGGRDSDPRQQTLRATIEWSHELLVAGERKLFARLAVFAGGCTLRAAEQICDAELDTLQSLVEKSLLRFTPSKAGSRYWMLETIREYALERLTACGEVESLRDRHLEWTAAETYARTVPLRGHDPEAIAFLRAEEPNIREALEWAIEREASEAAHRIFWGAWFYWITRGYAAEGDEWGRRVVGLPSPPTEHYAWTLASAGEFPRSRGDPQRALELKLRAIDILEKLGEGVDPRKPAAIHADVGDILAQLGDLDRAAEHAELGLSLRRTVGDPWGIAHALGAVARVAERRDDAAQALRLYDESVVLLDEAGTPLEAAWALVGGGNTRRLLGDLAGATTRLEDALQRSLESEDKALHAETVAVLGFVAADDGDPVLAVRRLAQAREEARGAGLVLDAADEVESVLAECRSVLGDTRYEAELRFGTDAAAADSGPTG